MPADVKRVSLRSMNTECSARKNETGGVNGARPTHGYWCNAKIGCRPCGRCEQPVLFLGCDCDCRVLLDEHEGALSVHACVPGLSTFSERDEAVAGLWPERDTQTERPDDMLLTSARRFRDTDVAVECDPACVARIQALRRTEGATHLIPVTLSFVPLVRGDSNGSSTE